MSLEEVEAIMGRPADFKYFGKGNYVYTWNGEEGDVKFSYDPPNCTTGYFRIKNGGPMFFAPADESPFGRQLRLLGFY
jgi:hypothetical protein